MLQYFFQYCQMAQNQPKSHFLFHRNVSMRNSYIMILIPTHTSKVPTSLFALWATSDIFSSHSKKTSINQILVFIVAARIIVHTSYLSVLDFFKSVCHDIDFWTWFLNLIFHLFQTWLLLPAVQLAKIKFQIDKKSSWKISFVKYIS